MNENKNVLRYEYEALKVGDADAILIRHYIDDEPFIVLIDGLMQAMLVMLQL